MRKIPSSQLRLRMASVQQTFTDAPPFPGIPTTDTPPPPELDAGTGAIFRSLHTSSIRTKACPELPKLAASGPSVLNLSRKNCCWAGVAAKQPVSVIGKTRARLISGLSGAARSSVERAMMACSTARAISGTRDVSELSVARSPHTGGIHFSPFGRE